MTVLDDCRENASTGSRPEPLVLLIHQPGQDMSRVHDHLEQEAFRVRRATSYSSAGVMARGCHPDVVVLRTDSTDNGLQLMHQILSERAVPVIVLATAEQPDPVEALEHGADDYMVDPVALPEIAARARAAVRRSQRPSRRRVRRVGVLELDTHSRRVLASNRRLALTPMEYSLLDFLSETPGHVVTHTDLVGVVVGLGGSSTTKLCSRIQRLRSKLAAAGVHDPFITAVRGVGYRLDT